jgi:hypothetical protein
MNERFTLHTYVTVSKVGNEKLAIQEHTALEL